MSGLQRVCLKLKDFQIQFVLMNKVAEWHVNVVSLDRRAFFGITKIKNGLTCISFLLGCHNGKANK